MPRKCVFCSATADSQEHVWPKWAAPMLADEDPLPHFQQFVQDDRPGFERSYPKAAYSMTVGAVCEQCNNTWMSGLESRAKPYLEGMLHGRGRLLHQGGQRTLAAWALKTAMMVEQTHGAHQRGIPVEEYTYLYEHGEPSDRIRIWMATYTGTWAVAMGRTFGLDADMASGPDSDRGRRDIWGAAITFGPVVFQVFGTAIHPLLHSLATNAVNTHVLWPYQSSFTWMPSPGFDEYGLVRFADGLLDEVRRHGQAAV
jgi:hypothetical protein